MGAWRRGGALAVLIAAVLIAGCGGSSDESTTASSRTTTSSDQTTAASGAVKRAPSAKAVIACFKREGVVSVYEKKERGVRFVNGLVNGAYAVSAEFTGDQATTDEFLERYEAEKSSKLVAFELLGGTVVGVINEEAPKSKKIVLTCLEKPAAGGQ